MTEDRLIDRKEFASVMGCGLTYFKEKWMTHPDFPESTGTYPGKDTWLMSKAQEFLRTVTGTKQHNTAA